MLRINHRREDGTIRLKLEGQLTGPWVTELDNHCRPALASGHSLELDLSEVSFADHGGARLLAGLAAKGAVLRELSAFLREQIRQQSPAPLTDRRASG